MPPRSNKKFIFSTNIMNYTRCRCNIVAQTLIKKTQFSYSQLYILVVNNVEIGTFLSKSI